jgi:putative hydrolase of the HAD superfamily
MDAAAGTAAVLARARPGHGVTVERTLEVADRLLPLDRMRRRIRASDLEFPSSCFQRLLYERLGLAFDVSPLVLEQTFWDGSYERMPPTPGIDGFLDALGDRNIPTAVVSNASFREETLERELERAGLRDRLGFVMSSADYGLRKPDPAMLEVAFARLGVTPERSWYCGDRPEWDVLAARAAGAVAVRYAPDGERPGEPAADLAIRHWDEATALLVDAESAP